LIRGVCPIHGVSIGNYSNKSTWIPQFKPESTPEQRAAAQAVIDAFDDSPAAQAEWEEDQKPERKAVRQAVAQAVADIDEFLALNPPTQAQAVQQVRRLSQMMRAVIKRLAQLD